jgi:hypothetical protein
LQRAYTVTAAARASSSAESDQEAAAAASPPDAGESTAAAESDEQQPKQQPGRGGGGGGGRGAAADGAGASPSGRGHLGLDDPDLNVYLSYNKGFKTDEERLYKVGMIAAMERKGRTALREALAAHRLALRDAAALPSALRGPSSLADRMAVRLAEMEGEVRRVEGSS